MMRDEDEEGSTPLLLGVGSGTTRVVELLVDNKANVNQHNKVRTFSGIIDA